MTYDTQLTLILMRRVARVCHQKLPVAVISSYRSISAPLFYQAFYNDDYANELQQHIQVLLSSSIEMNVQRDGLIVLNKQLRRTCQHSQAINSSKNKSRSKCVRTSSEGNFM